MRLITLLFTGLFMMVANVSSLAAATDSGPAAPSGPAQQAELTRLANGLTVLIKQDHRFPLVSLRLYVRAGSTYEKPEEAGISHMLEHMVFKGTDKRPKNQVAADVEGSGGYLNAGTSFDYTVYLTDMTREHWKVGLDVLKDMAFHPALDPEELQSEKDVVVAELKRGEDNPGQRLFRMTQQAALQGTAYFDPIIGYEETIRGLTSEAMRAYINELYQPQSMLLVVCGDVTSAEVLAEAQRLFGDLRNTGPVTPPSPNLESVLFPRGFKAILETGPWNKVYISLALPVPGLTDLRSAQLDVLAQILGGDATSRFYRKYKYTERLVDAISVSNYSFERAGLLYIQATLDADKLAPFWAEFSTDLALLGSVAFTQEELDRAKLNLEDDLFRSKETLAGYASKLGYFALFDKGEQGEANYLHAIRGVNSAILSDLIRTYFHPNAFSFVGLLPEGAQLPEELRVGASSWQSWITRTLAVNWPAPLQAAPHEGDAGQAGQAEVIELGKGRTVVLTQDTTLPYTAVNLLFTGGDTLLAEEDQGLAAFTASLLGKGAGELSATEIEDYLSDRAAAFSASTGRQTFNLSMNAPARFTPDMFALLDQVLASPAMKDDEAARVRDNQMAAIVLREDQPIGLAFRRLFPFLFSGHPYGFLQLGEKERVAQFSARDAKEYWKKQIQQPWVLSVCGTFDKDAILAAAKKLPTPGDAESSPVVPQWNQEQRLDLTLPGRNQAHLFLVFPTVGYGAPDEATLDLLQNILAGQSGLLFRDLRDEQGLGYTVTAFPWKAEKTGALIFYIGTEPDKMAQAEQGFKKVIEELTNSFLADEELQRGKNQMQGDYYRDHQTLASRSAEGAILTVLRRPLDAARKLVEKAQTVDAAAIQAVARTYLQPEKAYIVKVLP